jgi:hypothetical protein
VGPVRADYKNQVHALHVKAAGNGRVEQ